VKLVPQEHAMQQINAPAFADSRPGWLRTAGMATAQWVLAFAASFAATAAVLLLAHI